MADNIFTNVGEFQYRRGKGNRQTRLGPRTATEGPRRTTGKTLTPDQIALNKLKKLLNKPGMITSDRYGYIDMLANAEQLRFMNMAVVAQVILFMRSMGNQVTEENFNYEAIVPYIDQLLPRTDTIQDEGRSKQISPEELEIMRLRMAATFLRYIRYILILNEQQKRMLYEAQLAEAEAAAITTQQLAQ